MAFVCTLSPRGSLLPLVAADAKLTSLTYPIGYEDTDGSAYRLFISFGSAPGGIIEYSFCIVSYSRDGTSRDFWDSREVAAMVSKGDRALILRLLLEATEQMIKSVLYPEVTMHAISRDLPPKALVKYRYIAQLFANEGYRVRTKQRHGQHIWWFDRKGAKPHIKRSAARRRRRR